MYHPIKGGTQITLRYEGNYQVWIPPKPSDNAIAGYHLKKSEQMFKRTPLPDYFEERASEEAYKRTPQLEEWEAGLRKYSDVFTDQVLEEFRREEWYKRNHGFWFFNCGEPVYITGTHYFYLNWTNWDHSDNDGFPIFYENQIHRFYFRRLCETDPNCLGYILLGPRGFGKSTEELGAMLDRITKSPRNQRSFLQSKTDDDAQEVLFKSKLVPAFNKLPDFFKPVYSHSSDPSKELSFKRPRVSGAKARTIKYKPEFELSNTIGWAAAGQKTLDGESANDILCDEIGKSKPHIVRVDKRVKVNRFVVYRNNRKRGIQRNVSTVEELEEGGQECKNVWDLSDPSKRTPNNQTLSSLYRVRESILDTDTQFEDEFGRIRADYVHPNMGVTVVEYHKAERKAREYDHEEWADWVRKNPIHESDMWVAKPGSSTFNSKRLTEYKNELAGSEELWIRGNFSFSGKPFESKVIFERDDHGGRWQVAVLLDDKDDNNAYGKANNWMKDYDYELNKKVIMPLNRKKMHFGVDTIKDIKVKNSRASKMSAHLKLKYIDNLDRGQESKNMRSSRYIARYVHRSEDPQDNYMDVAMAMLYYGTWANIEGNVASFHTWLRGNNMDKFIMKALDFERDSGLQTNMDKDDALQSTPAAQQAYINALRSSIKENLPHRLNWCPFIDSINQLIEFDPKNWTIYDEVVSMGFAELADDAVIMDEYDQGSDEESTDDWMDTYDISGDDPTIYDVDEQLFTLED